MFVHAGSLSLLAGLTLLLPSVTHAAERPAMQPRRAETLDRLRAKYPEFRFKLDPGAGEAAPMSTLGMAANAPASARTAAPLEGQALLNAAAAADFDPNRILAGHLLRRATFGPTPAEVNKVLELGAAAWVDAQLAIRTSPGCGGKLPQVDPAEIYNDYSRQARWYARMVCTQGQLNEKMTLIWHELFATSNEKVRLALLMEKQEAMLRRNALGSFRDLLLKISVDQAMLIFLDNDPNSGTLKDENGNPIPPNRNFAREFLQLMTLGAVRLYPNGTPVLDGNGVPEPSYTEADVNEVARALTGFEVDWENHTRALFLPADHDSGPKTILGVQLAGRRGRAGRLEVDDVVNIVMAHPNLAPFISKFLVQKLATEQPSPEYVERVASVFQASAGDIKQTVRAILLDPEFAAPANLRTGYKEPIEHFVGAARALGARTDGASFIDWTYLTKQLVYYPPSIFSFYPPGQRRQLVNTATVNYRDKGADELAAAWWSTKWNAAALIKLKQLSTPEQAVDWLSDALLQAPLQSEVRQRIVDYFEGSVDPWKFRGAVWLVMASPDYQRW